MDEGRAALYAAIIGFAAAIIGAAVGGWASGRAARHSAGAAIQAAIEQTAGQARSEHAQWMRQERRQAYGQILKAFDEYRRAATHLLYAAGTSDARLQLDEYDLRISDVRVACLDSFLFAPDELYAPTMKLLEALNEAQETYHAAAEQEPGAPDLAEIRQAASEQSRALHGELGGLVALWSSTLEHPRAPTPAEPPSGAARPGIG